MTRAAASQIMQRDGAASLFDQQPIGADRAPPEAKNNGGLEPWQEQKLADIATLTRGEILGWCMAIGLTHGPGIPKTREPFQGETAALIARCRVLGLSWPPKSDAGPNG